MPWPSADTVILGQRAVLFTWKVPSARRGQDLRQAPSSQAKGTFICKRSTAADHRRKPEAKVAQLVRLLAQARRACWWQLAAWADQQSLDLGDELFGRWYARQAELNLRDCGLRRCAAIGGAVAWG